MGEQAGRLHTVGWVVSDTVAWFVSDTVSA